jgi:hypothetical protein
MQQKNMVLIGFQRRHELADLEGVGAKVARSDKANTVEIDPGTRFSLGFKRLEAVRQSKNVLNRTNRSSSAKNCIQVGSSE